MLLVMKFRDTGAVNRHVSPRDGLGLVNALGWVKALFEEMTRLVHEE